MYSNGMKSPSTVSPMRNRSLPETHLYLYNTTITPQIITLPIQTIVSTSPACTSPSSHRTPQKAPLPLPLLLNIHIPQRTHRQHTQPHKCRNSKQRQHNRALRLFPQIRTLGHLERVTRQRRRTRTRIRLCLICACCC
jgi:hypothetical protein